MFESFYCKFIDPLFQDGYQIFRQNLDEARIPFLEHLLRQLSIEIKNQRQLLQE